MNNADFEILLDKIKKSKIISDKIKTLGGLSQKITQSDKLGYNWIEDYIGETLVKQTYV